MFTLRNQSVLEKTHMYRHIHILFVTIQASKAKEKHAGSLQKKLNCPEWGSNPQFPANMAGTLTPKPPSQLSRLRSMPSIHMQYN